MLSQIRRPSLRSVSGFLKTNSMAMNKVSVLIAHENQGGELGAITAELDSIMTDASNKKLVQYDHAH